MYFRLLTGGVLAITLVMLTDTRSQADCDDDDDGCCVRVCRPCRPCPQPTCSAPAPTGNFCICPYCYMGGFWYAERFDWTMATDCMNGTPVVSLGPGPCYCVPPNCGCGIRSAASSTTEPCPPYLADCIDPKNPPLTPYQTKLIPGGGPLYLEIEKIDGKKVSHPTFVAYYHRVTTAQGQGSPASQFWIGWECKDPTPRPGLKRDAVTDPKFGPDCYSAVWVELSPGNPPHDNRILIWLTKNGCSN